MALKREYNVPFDIQAKSQMRIITRKVSERRYKNVDELVKDLCILGNISETYKKDFSISSDDLKLNKYGKITNNPFLREIDDLKEKIDKLIDEKTGQ